MRLFIFTIFLIPSFAYSQSCLDLEKDLLNLESELQNSRMVECSEENRGASYCRYRDSNNLTYSEVLHNYNKALANLVIHNGIEAITAALQGSHNSVANITPEKLDNAKRYVDMLEESLSKAEVLEVAMTAIEGTDGTLSSFWHKYNFEPNQSKETFEDKFRAACREKNEDLCQKITDLGIVFRPENEIFETLYGFANAEMWARPVRESNPESFYSEHRDKLKITVYDRSDNSSETISASEYRDRFFSPNGKMFKLKRAMERLSEAPNNSSNAAAVVEAAVALDTISTSYGVESNSTDYREVDGQLNINFQKPFVDLQIDLTDAFTTEVWEQNLADNISRAQNDQNVLEEGLNRKISQFASEFADGRCDDLSPQSCLQEICDLDDSTTACQSSRLNGLGITPIVEEFNRVKSMRSFSNQFAQARECYSRDTLELKRACLLSIRENLAGAEKTTKAEFEADLEAARAELDKYNSTQPFISITERKVLAIAALENNGCIGEENITENTCSRSLDGTISDSGALTLSSDLGNIAIRLNRSMLNDAKGAERLALGAEEFSKSEEAFIQSCDDGTAPTNSRNLCGYYESVREEETARVIREERRVRNEENRRIARSRSIAYQEVNWDSNDKSNGSIIGAGIMQGLMQPNPITGQTSLGTLVSGTAGYFQTKSDMKNMSRRIAAQESLFEARQNYLESIRPNLYSDAQYLPYNGGYIHNGYVYDKNFQAQAAGGYLYAPTSNPLSYNFQTSLPVGTPGNSGGITPVPTTSPSPAGIAPPPSSVPDSIPFNFSI